jgi:hypothetical protein
MLASAAQECAAADRLLGPDDPLAEALHDCRSASEQLRALALTGAAGLGLAAGGARAGFALTIAAALVAVVLGMRLVVLVERRQAACEDLIIAQRAPRALPSVDREWRRVADPYTRDRLAESLERIARIAEDPGDPPTVAPYFDLRVAHAVKDDLREVAALLRNRSSGVAGVALVERLLSTATSSLHGEDERALRDDLARVRFRLVNGA